MALRETDKDRLAAHWHSARREMKDRIVPDAAFPGTRLLTDEEVRDAMYGGLTSEESQYVQSLCAQAGERAREQLALVEERVAQYDPADDPVLKRIDAAFPNERST